MPKRKMGPKGPGGPLNRPLDKNNSLIGIGCFLESK